MFMLLVKEALDLVGKESLACIVKDHGFDGYIGWLLVSCNKVKVKWDVCVELWGTKKRTRVVVFGFV